MLDTGRETNKKWLQNPAKSNQGQQMNPKNTIAMKTIQTGNQNIQEHEKSITILLLLLVLLILYLLLFVNTNNLHKMWL